MSRKSGRQRGNALFLILIAVALFAALSYAITQSGRGGGNIDKEQAKLYAAQIVQIQAEIEQGMQRMILNGTAVDDIWFGTDGANYAGYGVAQGGSDICTTDEKCLFSAEGGGLTGLLPALSLKNAFDESQYGSWYEHTFEDAGSFNGFTFSTAQSVEGAGTAAADVTLQVTPLKKEICEEINRSLGIEGVPDTWVDGNPKANPHNECVHQGGTYMYYVVLIEK